MSFEPLVINYSTFNYQPSYLNQHLNTKDNGDNDAVNSHDFTKDNGDEILGPDSGRPDSGANETCSGNEDAPELMELYLGQ